jgi:hypothetical protein
MKADSKSILIYIRQNIRTIRQELFQPLDVPHWMFFQPFKGFARDRTSQVNLKIGLRSGHRKTDGLPIFDPGL